MIVLKIGGGEGNAIEPVLDDFATLWKRGERFVLVHGGSARTNEVATRLGHTPEFVTSASGFTSRRTDRQTARIFAMVYAGEINTLIVEALQARGVDAVGLSGVDGRLLEGTRKATLRILREGRPVVLRDDYTGTVERVNTRLLKTLIDAGHAPVVSPPAISTEHEIINVDGDRAAAKIASSLRATTLMLLTGAPGLLRTADDPRTLISHLGFRELDNAISQFAKGRMRIKLLAAKEAIEGGVERVILAASDRSAPVTSALAGIGTTVSRALEGEIR